MLKRFLLTTWIVLFLAGFSWAQQQSATKTLSITVNPNTPTICGSVRCFYIDFSTGLNSNPGTKASPWKSHPYMRSSTSCGGALPTYIHQAGDQFIFKGGETWPVACFQMLIPTGGTVTKQDYYGVDLTWYSGGSFSKPKIDLTQLIPTSNHVFNFGASFGGYATFDTIEIVNQGLSLGIINADDAFNFSGVTVSMPGVLIVNVNAHDWISNTDLAGKPSSYPWPYSAGCINDGHNRITVSNTTCSDAGGWVYLSGVKHTGGYSGGCVNCLEVRGSTFHDGGAGCFTVSSCHDSEFYNISQSQYDLCACRPHSQVIEDDFTADTSSEQVFNNRIHDNPNVGVSIYVPYWADVYNNVLSNTKQYILLGNYSAADSSSKVGHTFNNTMDCSGGGHCIARDTKGTGLGTLYLYNNLSITNGTPICIGGTCSSMTTLHSSTNYTMPTSEAATYGYTNANKYNPTGSDPNVVSQGTDVTSFIGGSRLAQLGFDTKGAPWFGASYIVRPSNPDIGAYQH
jgi:hypothetical protein